MSRRRAPLPLAPAGGFTLIEIVTVMAILGLMLLILPPRLDSFGDRSRLQSSANSLASALTAARELAIIDGHDTILQYDLPGDLKDREKTGRWRYVLSARSRETPRGLEPEGTRLEERKPPVEDEWMETEWRSLPAGVVLAGYSEESGQWVRSNPKDSPIEVTFTADGSVRPPHALRLVSLDMPERDEERTMTVRVNALTAACEVVTGEADLPKPRDPNEFR